MKVLILNGSPRLNGNTTIAIQEMEKIFAESGVKTETVQIGMKDVRGCIACGRCAELGRCVFDDVVKLRGMDIVFVTTAKTNEEALALLKGFGLPFRK